MKTKQLITIVLSIIASFNAAWAYPVCHITSYYETSKNEPLHHVCGILQDQNGMIWIATWGGMFSFDGIKFSIHEEQETKTLGIAPGHSRGIEPCPTGDEWLLLDKPQAQYLADPFGTQWHMTVSGELYYTDEQGKEQRYKDAPKFEGYRGCFEDRQHNLWVLCYYAIHKIEFAKTRLTPVTGCENQPVRCMHCFDDGSYWLCQRQTGRVLTYNAEGELIGYLTQEGKISKMPAEFYAAVYCIYEHTDGSIWLGTKGAGAYRLSPQEGGGYVVESIEIDAPEGMDVYDIGSDRQGRIWLATLYGGVLCAVPEEGSSQRLTAKRLKNYEYENYPRARCLTLCNDTMIVATSEGLVVADLSVPTVDEVTFKYHKYDSNDNRSLSSNLADHVMVDSHGQLLVSTENGGVNFCTSASLLDDKLQFVHLDSSNGLPDIAFSLAEKGDVYWMTSLYSLSSIRWNGDNEPVQISRFGPDFFGDRYRLDEISPLVLDSNRWIVSTEKGAMIIDSHEMNHDGFVPNIVLTLLDNGAKGKLKYTSIPDTIALDCNQRSFRIEFAALDYSNPEGIGYLYRVSDIDTTWISLGNTTTLSFADITPGHHVLEIRSSNGQGQWTDNTRRIVLEVKPRFSETIWALILLILLASAVVCAIIYTIVYIRRIKEKHNQMLTAYLSVIGKRESAINVIRQSVEEKVEKDQFVTRLTEYINQNLSNSELRTEMMAEYMAVSLSTLTRNTKSLMGITPGDFLAKARIRKAEIMLLQQKNMSIAEVAYSCGFSDPKYFSRCFKQETKLSPSEYRSRNYSES